MFPLGKKKKKIRECVLPARLCGNTINGLRSLVAQYRSGCTWAIADKQQSYLAKVTHTINLPFTAGEKEKKQLGVIRSDSLYLHLLMKTETLLLFPSVVGVFFYCLLACAGFV